MVEHLGRAPGVVLVSIAAAMWGLDGLIRKPLADSTSAYTIVFGEHVALVLVTLPLIWQGVLSGWLFAFIVSFGELNTALFLTGPGLTTLPIEIFSYLQFQGSQLVIAAASTLQIALIVILVAVIERVVGIGRIIRAR
jgi:putative spermidine/putrescine transport system permease protein